MIPFGFLAMVIYASLITCFVCWLIYGKYGFFVGIILCSVFLGLTMWLIMSPLFGWWYIRDDVIYYSVALFWSKKLPFEEVKFIEKKWILIYHGSDPYYEVHCKSGKSIYLNVVEDAGLDALFKLHHPREIMEL